MVALSLLKIIDKKLLRDIYNNSILYLIRCHKFSRTPSWHFISRIYLYVCAVMRARLYIYIYIYMCVCVCVLAYRRTRV